MIRRPPRSTLDRSSAASDVYKRQGETTWIEDENGKLLVGDLTGAPRSSFPVNLDNEIIGWVKGDERSIMIANLLGYLAQKEAEKKKLGTEVLNLYQELNIIYN